MLFVYRNALTDPDPACGRRDDRSCHVNDYNGAVADMLDMVVEQIYVVIENACRVPPDDKDDEEGNNAREVSA